MLDRMEIKLNKTENPKTIIIIPARLSSTRLPEKVLQDICGKPMIEHVYNKAKGVRNADEVLIATDSEKIASVVKTFSGNVVLTSNIHKCGTNRVAEAVENLQYDIIINLQADEPLLNPLVIEELIEQMKGSKDCKMATVAVPLKNSSNIENSSVTKVVCDRHRYALYFSRSAIPYPRNRDCGRWLKHIGIYGYRKDFLFEFIGFKHSMLEDTEGLEQLRALENGYKIKVIVVEYDSIGVDTVEDLERVRDILRFQ
jgi:3-deoxy-manno-octulosonate cytidylyltransferase (CMP-KDO synthetase)